MGENLPLMNHHRIVKSERPTAVITAAVVSTTHARIINRSLVACDAAGPTDGMLWWLLPIEGGETRRHETRRHCRDHVVVVHTSSDLLSLGDNSDIVKEKH